MAETLFEILAFVFGTAFGVLWFSLIFLPIAYGLPKSLYYIAKGILKGSAIRVYLVTFIVWMVMFTVVGYVIVAYLPSLRQFLADSPGFLIGQWFGLIGSLIRALSKAGRTDLREAFWFAMRRFEKVPIADLVSIPGDAMKIIGEYSAILAENPDSTTLPYPKETILQALKTALDHVQDPKIRQDLQMLYIDLWPAPDENAQRDNQQSNH